MFIRPPKTASTSVEDMIKSSLGLTAEHLVPDQTVFHGSADAIAPQHRFVRGHVTWDDAAWMVADRSAWLPIMTIRDPLERTLSQYRFLRQRGEVRRREGKRQPMFDEVLARPLRELIVDESSMFYNWTMPVQTLFLGSPLRGRPPTGPLGDEVRSPACQHGALCRALERLERLAWIGIVESLGRDMQVLAFSQGWPVADTNHSNPTAPVDDESAAASELDPALLRLLANRLAADYVLLECAREIAAERYGEMVETMGIAASRRNGRA